MQRQYDLPKLIRKINTALGQLHSESMIEGLTKAQREDLTHAVRRMQVIISSAPQKKTIRGRLHYLQGEITDE